MYIHYQNQVITVGEWTAWQDIAARTSENPEEGMELDDITKVIVITRPIGIVEKIVAFLQLAWAGFIALFTESDENKAFRAKARDAYKNDQVIRILQHIPNEFDHVPNEIICHIFNHLDIPEKALLSRTCSKLYDLSQKPPSWEICASKICLFQDSSVPFTTQAKAFRQCVIERVSQISLEMLENTGVFFWMPFPKVFWPLMDSPRTDAIADLLKVYVKFFRSRDQLTLWRYLAGRVQHFAEAPDLKDLGIDEIIPKASEFDQWCQLRQQELNGVTELSVGINTEMCSLPKEIGYLTNLTKLSVRLNGLERSDFPIKPLPLEITQLQNLRTLEITGPYDAYDEKKKDLGDLPKNFDQLKQLEVLKLNGYGFNEFPSVILGLTSLTQLDISDNPIESIPAEIRCLNQLKHLDVLDTHLETLPSEIGQLTDLKTLYASSMFAALDSFKYLPIEFFQLKKLDVSNCLIPNTVLLNTVERLGLKFLEEQFKNEFSEISWEEYDAKQKEFLWKRLQFHAELLDVSTF